jgi:hypothetical protein
MVARSLLAQVYHTGKPLATIPVKGSHELKNINKRHHPAKATVSYKCKIGECNNCTKSNCTCKCGHPPLE